MAGLIPPHVLSMFCPPHRVMARYLEAVYRPKGPAKSWEKRKENDEFTEMNIPEELIPLWKKVKNQFKGDPHSRYEHFMEYYEEHPEEAIYAKMEIADKMLKEQEKQEKKEMQCRKRCPSCYRDEDSGGDASDVPF